MKIPTYESQVGPSTTTREVGSIPGEHRRPIIGEFVPDTTIGSIGKALGDIGRKMMEAERVEQYNDAQHILDKGTTDLIQDAKENTKEWGELTIDEHNEKFRERYDSLLEQSRAKIKDSKARRAFDSYSNAKGVDTEAAIKHIAWTRTVDRGAAKLLKQADEGVNIAIGKGDIKAFYNVMAKIDGAVSTGVLDKKAATELKERLTERTGIGFSRRLIYTDPMNALSILEKNPPKLFAMLNEDTKTMILNEARSARKRHITNSRKTNYYQEFLLDEAIRDSLAKMEITGKGTPGIVKRIYEVYTDPDRAKTEHAKYESDARSRRDIFQVRTDIEDNTIADNIKLLNGLNPENIEGDIDYNKKVAKYKVAIMEYNRKITALNTDPVSWVLSKNPNADIGFIKSEQIRQGLAEDKISLLTAKQANELADKITTSTGDDTVKILDEQRQKFGDDNYDIVFRDLTRFGKLPSSFQLINSADNDIDKRDVAEALKTGPKELRVTLGEDSREKIITIENEIDTEMEKFDETVVNSGLTPNNIKNNNALKDGIKSVAIYLTNKGMDSDDAAEKAAKIVTSKYNFADGYRVPKKYNFDNVMDNIRLINKYGINRELLNEVYSDKYIEYLRDDMKLINNSNDDGVLLVDGNNMPVLGKDKKPIMFLFKDFNELPPDYLIMESEPLAIGD